MVFNLGFLLVSWHLQWPSSRKVQRAFCSGRSQLRSQHVCNVEAKLDFPRFTRLPHIFGVLGAKITQCSDAIAATRNCWEGYSLLQFRSASSHSTHEIWRRTATVRCR
jgi:hypothetical protein